MTKPLNHQEKQKIAIDRSTARLMDPDTENHLQRLFLENGWTDRLPIVVPTEERVAMMLSGTRRKADEVVGTMQPTRTREGWQFTVEKVAVISLADFSRASALTLLSSPQSAFFINLLARIRLQARSCSDNLKQA